MSASPSGFCFSCFLSDSRRLIDDPTLFQLFGDNPPSALFQITNIAVGVSGDDACSLAPSLDGHGRHRDSLATIISISTTSLSHSLSGNRLRDSYISVITTSSDVSAIVVKERKGEEEDDDEDEETPTSEDEKSLPPIPNRSDTDKTVFPSASEPNLKDKAGRTSTSTTSSSASGLRQNAPRLLSLPSEAVIHQPPRTPPTPPPFSDYPSVFVVPRPATAPPPATSTASPEFQTRRRRAAKLSKFFGVGVSELAEVLPPDILSPAVPAKAMIAQEQGFSPELTQRPSRRPSTTVAEAKNRRRFLGGVNEEHDVKEVDMTEVIDQLRRMKPR